MQVPEARWPTLVVHRVHEVESLLDESLAQQICVRVACSSPGQKLLERRHLAGAPPLHHGRCGVSTLRPLATSSGVLADRWCSRRAFFAR